MDEFASRVIDASDAGHLVRKGLRSNAVRHHACSVGDRRDISPVFAEQVVDGNHEVGEGLSHASICIVGTRIPASIRRWSPEYWLT